LNLPAKFIKEFGLEAPSHPVQRRLVLVGYGEKATGKTDFCLRTMPRPLLHINLDKNTEGLEERYMDADITFKHVHVPVKLHKDTDYRVLMQIHDLVLQSMEAKYFRSYAIDTGDKFYELARRGVLGTLDFGEAKQSDYAEINNLMFQLFNKAKDSRANFAMLHHCTNERKSYVNASGKRASMETGNRVMSGWKKVKEPAQCVVKFYKDPKEVGIERYKMLIEECNARPEIEGEILTGDEIDFLRLGKAVFYPFGKLTEEWL